MTPIRTLLRRLLSQRETYLLFARHAQAIQIPVPEALDAFQFSTLTQVNDPLTQPLDPFCTSHGFPPNWPAQMLVQGAHAVMAIDSSTRQIAAMAWLTTRPYYVEEIDHTLDPAGGVYLFGDFVAPAYRGRRLQRTLLAHRLSRFPTQSAYTIIRDDNAPSIRNFESVDFIPTTHLIHKQWLGRASWACTPAPAADKRLPTFERLPGNRLVPRT